LPASPAEEPDVPAPAAEEPDAGITRQEPAHDRWPSREAGDRAATPPTPPERPLSPAEPDHPALPSDDFWNRVNEELAVDAEREPDSPPRAASAGPPPPAVGGDLWSRPADRRADEVTGAGSGAGDARPGRPAAGEHWSAWAPSVSSPPGSPPAGDEDESRDRADEGAAGQRAEAGTLGPLFAWRDAAADHASAAGTGTESTAGAGKESPAGTGKETADAGKEADVTAEEADEEEEAAPSPWSIPLTLVGDLSDLDEEGDGQPAGPGAAGDHGTGEPPAAQDKPAPELTVSDVWTRSSWTAAQEKQAGPARADDESGAGKPDEADRAGAGRGPWLTRPGKDTTAGWAARDPGDAAATDGEAGADDHAKASPAARDDAAARAGRDDAAVPAGRGDADKRAGRAGADADDHAEAPRAGRDADDRATAGRTADWAGRDAGALPTRAGRDPGDAMPTGADDHAKATPAGRDAGGDPAASRVGRGDAAVRAGRDEADVHAGRDGAADDEAKPSSAGPAEKGTPVGRPSATLFGQATGATRGSAPDPAAGKTAVPGTPREAPGAAEAGSGTGTGQTGPAPAAAGDGDKRSATEQSGAERSGPAAPPDSNAVVIVPGVARYHRTGCILIRFLGGDDLETLTAQEAKAQGCAPCRACEPDKPLSSGD